MSFIHSPRPPDNIQAAINNVIQDYEYQPSSKAECIALALYEKALKGDVTAIRELADRTEGKSPATVNLNPGDIKAERYRQLAQRLASKYGKPVDEVIRDMIDRDPSVASCFEGWIM